MKNELKNHKSNVNISKPFSILLIKGLLYGLLVTIFIMICMYLCLKNLDQVIEFLTAIRDCLLAEDCPVTIFKILLITFPIIFIIVDIAALAFIIADVSYDSKKQKNK